MATKIQTARQPRFGFDRNSALGRFWRWWSGELRELVPKWLLHSAGSSDHALLIEIGLQSVVVRRWIQGALVELGRLDLRAGDHAGRNIAFQALITKLRKRDDRIALWLADSQFLTKQIELPLAAEENLRQVLAFEMDRHTPFKADQVYFDFRITRRDSQNQRLMVDLVVAPRVAVDPSLDQLARCGVPAHAVYVASATAPAEDAIDLMPQEHRVAKTSMQLWVNLALLGLAAVLAISAIAIPIWQKRRVAIALAPKVEQAKLQATATDALRREWEKLSAEYNFVLEKKRAVPPLVMQLDELSRLLTDDTWVQQFDLKGKELQIQGETASSSKLIALVESSNMLSEASFRSPLTKGQAPNSERFHLGGEVKPLSASAFAALRPAPVAAATPATAVAPAVAPTAPPPPQSNTRVEVGKSGSATAPTASPAPQSISRAEAGKLGAANASKAVPVAPPPSQPAKLENKADLTAKPAPRPIQAPPVGAGNAAPASPKAPDNTNPGTTRPNLGRQP